MGGDELHLLFRRIIHRSVKLIEFYLFPEALCRVEKIYSVLPINQLNEKKIRKDLRSEK